jgi:hypothetical protein
MLTHLHDCWGMVDFVDITALLSECNTPWNAAEVPTKYFNRTDKARRQLACANIQVDKQAMMVKALKSFKDAGDFDAAICEWEARPVATQYANLKVVMCAEFSKLNWQDSTTERGAGNSSANNVMGEMAQATTELVADLTEHHTQEIKSLIKSYNDAMEKLIAAISASNKPPAATKTNGAISSRLKAAAWAEKGRMGTTCLHCNCVHPNHTHNQFWNLPANAAKCPAN